MNHKVLLFAAYQQQQEKNENRKYILLVYIFYVLYECIQFHLIEYQDNEESRQKEKT